MQVEQQEIRDFLKHQAPFASLPEDWLDRIALNTEVAYFKSGRDILVPGDPINHLNLIRSGVVELYRRNGDLYNRLTEADLFGQLSLLMHHQRVRFPAKAVEDTLIYMIPADLFFELFDDQPDFAEFVEVEDRTRLRQAVATDQDSSERMNTPVSKLVSREAVLISQNASVQEAAERMTSEAVSSLIVIDPERPLPKIDAPLDPETGHQYICGIVTDRDLRRRVLAEGRPYDTPVGEIMSTDIQTIESTQYLFEALLVMLRYNVHHLPVVERRRPVGVIGHSDIVSHETHNSLFVVRNIFHCSNVDELVAASHDASASFVRMVNEGADSHMIGSAMATIGRSFKQRLLELGEKTMGPPPVPYCFLALGSMARDEQFLFTDQDNAMILHDDFDPAQHDAYFLELAQFVSDGLAACGYTYCKGEIMATTERWRQPYSVWEGYFREWIDKPNARALLNSSIFFDLDGVWGETHFANELKVFIAERASGNKRFLAALARNALNRTPPLGFFKDFVMETDGAHKNTINLKRRGTAPLTDVIRVHAMAAGSQAQNSFRRLEDIAQAGILMRSQTNELRDALEFICRVRVRHQAVDVETGRDPNNNITPFELSSFERRNLKDAFKVLSTAQKQLRFRYPPGRS